MAVSLCVCERDKEWIRWQRELLAKWISQEVSPLLLAFANPVTSTVMACLNDLPEELLEIILDYLLRAQHATPIGGCGTSSAAPLRLFSRRFCRLADPRMRCVVTEQYRFRLGPSELSRWAWKVARQPDCARFITEIHVRTWPPQDYGNSGEPPSRDVLAAAVRHPVEEELFQMMARKSDAANLAFLLASCPRLTVFTGCSTFEEFGPFVQKAMSLSSLSEIALGCEWGPYTVHEILPLFSITQLRKLTILRLGDGEEISVLRRSAHRNRIDLILEDCFLSGKGLARVLSACTARSLRARWLSWQKESFQFRHGARRCLSRIRALEPILEEIGDAIREHGHLLEHLHLDTTDLQPEGCLGSFKELPIKTLRVPLPLQTLPPTVEEICLLGCTEDRTLDCHVAKHVRVIRFPWKATEEESGSQVAYPIKGDTIGGDLAAWDWDWEADESFPVEKAGSLAVAIKDSVSGV